MVLKANMMMIRIGVIIDALEIIQISPNLGETYDYGEILSLDFLKGDILLNFGINFIILVT